MAVLAGASSTPNTGDSTTPTGLKPAGVANGHVLIAGIIMDGVDVTSAPSGWVQIVDVTDADAPHYAYYKVITDAGSEPATYVWGSVEGEWAVGITILTGADTTNVLDTGVSEGTHPDNAITLASLTTTMDGALLIGSIGSDNDDTYSPAPGMTEQWEEVALGRCGLNFATEARPTAGATGTRAFSRSATTGACSGWMVAIRPADAPTTTDLTITVDNAGDMVMAGLPATFTGGTAEPSDLIITVESPGDMVMAGNPATFTGGTVADLIIIVSGAGNMTMAGLPATFTGYQEPPAFVPAYRPPTLTWTVRINGVLTPTRAFRTSHSVDKPIATGSITIKAPKPVHAEIGAPVTIHAGYDGASLPIFSGTIPNYRGAFSSSGGEVQIELEGKGRRLFYGHDTWLGVQGPLRMFSWWRSLAHYVGIENYWADATEDVDGFDLMLGANDQIHDGIALVDRRSSPGAEMARLARLFGYRHFETATHIRLQRVSGLPTDDVEDLVTFEEGVNVREIRREESMEGIANYWDVYGAEYTAVDESEVAIRSLPAVIIADPLFGPSGVAREEIRDNALTTIDLADACRNAHEVDYSEPSSTWSWETRGDPERTPGEQIALLSQKVGPQVEIGGSVISFPVAAWLMSVEHDGGPGGWTTRMTGWTGAGTALPAGSDCTTISLLGSQGVHLGDETLSHYRNPSPNGNTSAQEHRIAFVVPDDYTTATILGIGHGTNSFLPATESNVSRFEIWQGGERATDSGELPVLPERVEAYDDGRVTFHDGSTSTNPDYFWSKLVIPLSGSLAAGAAELRIISGTDTGSDDFEVASLTLRLCGVGTPLVVGSYGT